MAIKCSKVPLQDHHQWLLEKTLSKVKEPPDDLVAKSSSLLVKSKVRDQKVASSSVTYVLWRNVSPSPKDNGFLIPCFPFPDQENPQLIQSKTYFVEKNRIAYMDARALSDD